MVVRVRRLLLLACVALLPTVAGATTPRSTTQPATRIVADTLTAMPAAQLAKPLRTSTPLVSVARPPVAWMALAAKGHWEATWDPATGVPRQIWGRGVTIAHANANAAIGLAAARSMLADQLALLAPGASVADFQLVSNSDDGQIRTVAFAQYASGHRVVGAQLSFWFEHDHLFVISSQALPQISFSTTRARLAPAALGLRATATIRDAVTLPQAPVVANGDDVVLPLIGDAAVMGYRLVSPFTIDGGAEGRYQAYVDPTSGDVIAIHQLNEYATGTVRYHGTDRYPGRGRKDYPAVSAHVTVAGAPQTTGEDGTISWGDGSIALETTTDGDKVTIVDAIEGLALGEFAIDPGSTTIWDASGGGSADAKPNDAQVNAYINANLAKQYVRAHVDAQMLTLEDVIKVNVNLAQDCNAFFDGAALNFFHATAMCENTALIQDVVFHEYGHRVHTAEIINGVGSFDGAMSEGVADFLAVSITGDSGMGRGFFYTDAALRELDPPDHEWRWPIDIGEIHHTGMIIGGTLWDLRKAFISKLGDVDGVVLANKLYVGALRRSVDIPTSLLAVLAADDDNGDLTDGTPNECAIRNTYGAHGLRSVTGTVNAPGEIDDDVLSVGIVISVAGLSERCTGDALGDTKLAYAGIVNGDPIDGSVTATGNAANQFFAQLPLAPYGVMKYQAQVGFADGSVFTLPDNLGDPYYQTYTGHVVKLYCTDFESEDPFANGWTSSVTTKGMPLATTWAWGTPAGGATDPHAAFSGGKIIAQVLDGDYAPTTSSWLQMPPVDVGRYTDVRLQYRRWLAVEDSHYDKATIQANGAQTWVNYTANIGDSSSTHHIDKEWRFQDVSLTPAFFGHTLNVRWSLVSDEGLNLGGWQIDDVCVVANPNSICGDGVKTNTESCDEGSANADLPNKCRTYCKLPACGDGIVDVGEECDQGSATDTCSATCKVIAVDTGGCCSASGGSGSLVLGLGVILLAMRRRRV